MISSQLHRCISDFDEIVSDRDSDFAASGLKRPRLIRIARLGVTEGRLLVGTVGAISPDRLHRLQRRLAHWLTGTP
jgi:hypothetical protein